MAIREIISADNLRVAQQIILPDQEFTTSPAWVSVGGNKYDIVVAGYSRFTVQFKVTALEGSDPAVTLRLLQMPAPAYDGSTEINPEVTPAKVYEKTVYAVGETEPEIGSNIWPFMRIAVVFDTDKTTRVVVRSLIYLWGGR